MSLALKLNQLLSQNAHCTFRQGRAGEDADSVTWVEHAWVWRSWSGTTHQLPARAARRLLRIGDGITIKDRRGESRDRLWGEKRCCRDAAKSLQQRHRFHPLQWLDPAEDGAAGLLQLQTLVSASISTPVGPTVQADASTRSPSPAGAGSITTSRPVKAMGWQRGTSSQVRLAA